MKRISNNIFQEAFVYCWTDRLTNKFYVGSHKGSIDDGYVCSSKCMLTEYKKRPHDFTRQVIAYGSYPTIRNFEAAILKSLDAMNDPSFYNKHNGNGKFYLDSLTEEHRLKIKMTCIAKHINKGKKHSAESKALMSKNRKGLTAGEKNPAFGKPRSDDVKRKISNTRIKLGVSRDEKNPMFGKTRSDMRERNKLLKGSHWYNDGIRNLQLHDHEVLESYVRGRIKNKDGINL